MPTWTAKTNLWRNRKTISKSQEWHISVPTSMFFLTVSDWGQSQYQQHRDNSQSRNKLFTVKFKLIGNCLYRRTFNRQEELEKHYATVYLYSVLSSAETAQKCHQNANGKTDDLTIWQQVATFPLFWIKMNRKKVMKCTLLIWRRCNPPIINLYKY